VAVGEVETLRLRGARPGLSTEYAMSFAGVPAMIDLLLVKMCCGMFCVKYLVLSESVYGGAIFSLPNHIMRG
jgi:hypothetical protein